MITWVLLACTIATVYLWTRWKYSYWTKRNVPIAPGSFGFLGHFPALFNSKVHRWKVIDEYYRNHGGSTFIGVYDMFLSPTLYVGDPDLIKAICIKDFDHFVDRRSINYQHEKDQTAKEMLTNITGDHWKSTRSVLSTSFSSGRIKGMFPLVLDKADALIDYLHEQRHKDPEVKMKNAVGLYTMEVISSCAFGLDTNSFKDEDAVFPKKANDLFQIDLKFILRFIFAAIFPKLSKFFDVRISSPSADFFDEVVTEMMKQREIQGRRGDFLDIMMETREEMNKNEAKRPKYPFSDLQIKASSILFIIAGYDTTANTLSFASYCLAKDAEVQQRVREEMQKLLDENGSLTYQAVMEAKYLDACISETLRIYTPAHFLERKCTKDYVLPGTDVKITKGMIVGIPTFSLHNDERYWPDPETFKPERFLPENKEHIVAGTYFPFGLGPRNCIAMRFALMEAKVALARLILEFQLELAPGYELEIDNTITSMRPKNDVKLILTPLAEE